MIASVNSQTAPAKERSAQQDFVVQNEKYRRTKCDRFGRERCFVCGGTEFIDYVCVVCHPVPDISHQERDSDDNDREM